MDRNTVFLKYGHNGLCQMPSLKMARIVMLLKVTNNIFDIAIHQAIHNKIALGYAVFETWGHLY